jgi:uncharacterized protein YneF (UPF0154 family)
MKNTIRVLLIGFVILILVGFARGWFFVTTGQETAKDRMNVNLTIDADKIKSDANRVGEAASDLTGGAPSKTEPSSVESKSESKESDEVDRDPVTDQDSAFPARPVSPELAK